MDIKYLEEKFIQLQKELYGEHEPVSFYVPTEEHSSGFNKIEIDDMSDGEYSITEEDSCCVDEYLTFEGIVEKYPKITLNREYAFYCKFESWEDIELAFKGEKEIDLVRL
jgi:hypothetical protein